MADIELFADDSSDDNERMSQEEYEKQQRESHCQHQAEQLTRANYGSNYGEARPLLLSIEEGYAHLVCPECKKPPLWADDFMDGVIMGPVPVMSKLTGDSGSYPDYEPDGPYIELTVQRDTRQPLTLDDYQQGARKTAVYPHNGPGNGSGITYTSLGLTGEAGEVANQVKKIIRDDFGLLMPERKAKLIDELGDVLWYAAMLAYELDTTLSKVARGNLNKLMQRQQGDQIKGDRR
jgi:NTP pyrophosphatase (non-canonical NTP hydrolase)